MTESPAPLAKVCVEVSWEVCNKVGGIFTVVSSKAAQLVERYGNGYYLVGPYFPKKAHGVFEEKPLPDNIKSVATILREHGIELHYGVWLTKGNPQVILIDDIGFASHKDEIKKNLWDWNKIDSLNTDYNDFDEPVIWAYAAGMLVELLSREQVSVVGHFHEWLSGAALLYLKAKSARVGTVFTTHATMLGRTIASQDIHLFEELNNINVNDECHKYGSGTLAKHQMETQCAMLADAFTTVSEITGIEAEKLLGRKPDVLVLNGLDMTKFPTFEETSIKHKLFKAHLFDFLIYYFFPYYSFDLEETLVYFLAGRYEFHDKGIDVYLESLALLNERLKQEQSKKTVVAFIFVPGNVRAVRPELLESKEYFADIKDTVEDSAEDMKHAILHALISSKSFTKESILGEAADDLRPKILRFLRKGSPWVSTHDIYNDKSDIILQSILRLGLMNKAEDRVKIIYYPIYLTGTDGLLNTNYYESMLASHLGIFPSYYEPWGYTPLESAALGVPSITTDLAGFGRYICKDCIQPKNPGIWVIKRFGRRDDEVTAQLAETMHYYTVLPKQDRIANKITARQVANTCDWKHFADRYIEAHNLALTKLRKP